MTLFRTDDAWFGDDKLAHGLGAYAIAVTVPLVTPLAPAIGAAVAVAAGAALECVELVRFRRWQARGAPAPWPFLTDRVSLRDLAWDAAGAAAAAVAWAVAGL